MSRSIIRKHIETGYYGCLKCNFYIQETYRCKLDKCVHGDKNSFSTYKNKKEIPKCEGCKWSSYSGLGYVCMLPRCLPDLGNTKK